MKLVPAWQKFTHDNWLESQKKNHCLYVFHHEDDGDKPFYIGKAKHFGAKQDDGYKGSARYNAGYTHLIQGLLRSGFALYIAEIDKEEFDKNAEKYEQDLIHNWQPIRLQKTKPERLAVHPAKPWL